MRIIASGGKRFFVEVNGERLEGHHVQLHVALARAVTSQLKSPKSIVDVIEERINYRFEVEEGDFKHSDPTGEGEIVEVNPWQEMLKEVEVEPDGFEVNAARIIREYLEDEFAYLSYLAQGKVAKELRERENLLASLRREIRYLRDKLALVREGKWPTFADWRYKAIGEGAKRSEFKSNGKGYEAVKTIRDRSSDIWGEKDSFTYVHKPLHGKGQIEALAHDMSAADGSAKMGLMIRKGLNADSPFFAIYLNPTTERVTQSVRLEEGAEVVHSERVEGPHFELYLKLKRKRLENGVDLLESFYSYDGESWIALGSEEFVDWPEQVYCGMYLTSRDPDKEATAQFMQVRTRGVTRFIWDFDELEDELDEEDEEEPPEPNEHMLEIDQDRLELEEPLPRYMKEAKVVDIILRGLRTSSLEQPGPDETGPMRVFAYDRIGNTSNGDWIIVIGQQGQDLQVRLRGQGESSQDPSWRSYTVENVFTSVEEVFDLEVQFGDQGIRVYKLPAGGSRHADKRKLMVQAPEGVVPRGDWPEDTVINLRNSETGERPWKGQIDSAKVWFIGVDAEEG